MKAGSRRFKLFDFFIGTLTILFGNMFPKKWRGGELCTFHTCADNVEETNVKRNSLAPKYVLGVSLFITAYPQTWFVLFDSIYCRLY